MAAKQIADKLIADHFVAVFSKSYCPYCTRAKSVLSSYGLPAAKLSVVELDHDANGADIQAYLAEKTGQRTVPNIFINHEHIGGCDDLMQLKSSGKLDQLLKA